MNDKTKWRQSKTARKINSTAAQTVSAPKSMARMPAMPTMWYNALFKIFIFKICFFVKKRVTKSLQSPITRRLQADEWKIGIGLQSIPRSRRKRGWNRKFSWQLVFSFTFIPQRQQCFSLGIKSFCIWIIVGVKCLTVGCCAVVIFASVKNASPVMSIAGCPAYVDSAK